MKVLLVKNVWKLAPAPFSWVLCNAMPHSADIPANQARFLDTPPIRFGSPNSQMCCQHIPRKALLKPRGESLEHISQWFAMLFTYSFDWNVTSNLHFAASGLLALALRPKADFQPVIEEVMQENDLIVSFATS